MFGLNFSTSGYFTLKDIKMNKLYKYSKKFEFNSILINLNILSRSPELEQINLQKKDM